MRRVTEAAVVVRVGWALGIGRIGSIIGPVLGGILIALAPIFCIVSQSPATMSIFSIAAEKLRRLLALLIDLPLN